MCLTQGVHSCVLQWVLSALSMKLMLLTSHWIWFCKQDDTKGLFLQKSRFYNIYPSGRQEVRSFLAGIWKKKLRPNLTIGKQEFSATGISTVSWTPYSTALYYWNIKQEFSATGISTVSWTPYSIALYYWNIKQEFSATGISTVSWTPYSIALYYWNIKPNGTV